VGKHDTIIFLGDIGNVEMIRKIRGYKVLIMGNHDKGASNYERQGMLYGWTKAEFTKEYILKFMRERYPGWAIRISDYDGYWHAVADNGLFDEVYEGPLFITDKLLLSHEPIDLPFAFNIHGHDHSGWQVFSGHHLNVCAEHISYTPVNLNRLLKGGLLSKVDSIHRMTIDKAVEKKNKKPGHQMGFKTGYCPICDTTIKIYSNDSMDNCHVCGHHIVLHDASEFEDA
jgi:calcineurin-like phosphoesterase family protein